MTLPKYMQPVGCAHSSARLRRRQQLLPQTVCFKLLGKRQQLHSDKFSKFCDTKKKCITQAYVDAPANPRFWIRQGTGRDGTGQDRTCAAGRSVPLASDNVLHTLTALFNQVIVGYHTGLVVMSCSSSGQAWLPAIFSPMGACFSMTGMEHTLSGFLSDDDGSLARDGGCNLVD